MWSLGKLDFLSLLGIQLLNSFLVPVLMGLWYAMLHVVYENLVKKEKKNPIQLAMEARAKE